MRIKLFSLLLVLLCALPLTAAPPKGTTSGTALSIDNKPYIDANRILMFVTNRANFGRDLGGLFGNDYGTYFPYAGDTGLIRSGTDVRSPLYAGGLWIGAVDSATGQTRVTISEYSTEYVPGPMEGGTFLSDRPEFKVYKLYRDSLAGNPNQAYEDYLEYAIGQGAPWDTTAAGEIIPKMIGDQMLWSVCNDADATSHTMDAGSTAPLGLEVKQNVFAFSQTGALGNIVILQFQIFNKGGNTLQDAYFSIWTDPDLGGSGDDYVGCDTILSVGYIYNADEDDQQYGATTPCLGVDFFQGPLIETGNPSDYGLMWGDTLWGYRNMGMTSFNKYINGTDPDNFTQAYNYMRGLTRTGGPYIFEGDTLTYALTGDPVAGTGDLDIAPADRRFMMSTGPITFRPGDSTEIYAAIIVGQGANEINSIEVMKQLDDFAQQLYENGFNPPRAPAKPVVTAAVLPNEVTLSWTDTSEVDPGDYDFEGYTVWQGESKTGPWTELATYDVINDNGVAMVDSVKDMATGLVLPEIKRVVKNTGLNYHYTATVNALGSGKLRNASDYYFRVTAFSFSYYYQGKLAPNGERFKESETVVTVTPQAPMAGVHPQIEAHEVVAADHTAGISDGSVEAVVYDPQAVTGHTYQVTFQEDNPYGNAAGIPLGVAWFLVDLDTGDTLLANQINQTGDSTYFMVDGMLIRVLGPALAGKSYTYAAADPPNVSQAAQDDPFYDWYTGNNRWITGVPDNGGELLNGAIFMEPNFWGETSLGPLDYPIVEVRWRPMESYTDLNGDGNYDPGEPYVVDDPLQTQKAFMYQGFDSTTYLGFYDVPFTAWDVDDPENPRQLNVVMRDRDQNHQWDPNYNPLAPDTLLPRDGDVQYNYTWITTTDYDPTGTYYGDGTGGTVNFWSYDGGMGVWDAAWCMWIYQRGKDAGAGLERPVLAEECTLTLYPPVLIRATDTFTFTAPPPPAMVYSTAELDAIKAVPNPLYLYGGFDPNPGSKQLRFHHLPATCKISLFNIAGDHVRTIDKDDPSTAIASWDLLTEQGLPVASGIYIYVVDAPGFGQKIGKVAIFTEAEVLNIY